MPAAYTVNKILQNDRVTETVYKMKVDLGGAPQPAPGQFYMVRGWEGNDPLLSRPISVNDAGEGTVTFLYEVRGRGTHLLSQLPAGGQVSLLGPAGTGFPVGEVSGRVAVVTGGIGLAPMVYTAKSLQNCQVDFFCGFRDQSYELESLQGAVQRVAVATDSGREGQKGFVTDLFSVADYDWVLTCGPQVMMEKLGRACLDAGVRCLLSMERHMACGVGACLGCTCKTAHGAKCVCKEGPVFRAEEVIL